MRMIKILLASEAVHHDPLLVIVCLGINTSRLSDRQFRHLLQLLRGALFLDLFEIHDDRMSSIGVMNLSMILGSRIDRIASRLKASQADIEARR